MLSPSLPAIWEKSEDKTLMQIYMRAINYLQLKEETCMLHCLPAFSQQIFQKSAALNGQNWNSTKHRKSMEI